MSVIRTGRLTMAEAEFLLAMLWRALEECRLRSPHIRVHGIPGAVELSIVFVSRQDADLAAPRLKTDLIPMGEARTAHD